MPPKVKLPEPVPNAGLAGVPKVDAVVAAVPKAKGAGFEIGVDDTPAPPKVNGFGAAAVVEPKVDGAGDTSNNDFPKLKVDWVEAAVVETVLLKPKPPNEAEVVFWLGAAWPNVNKF